MKDFMKSLIKLTRAFVGVWSEFRRIRLLLEWIMTNGLVGTIGPDRFELYPTGLPPTAKEIKDAVAEKIEYSEVDEEVLAGQRAVELLKRRAKGEEIDPSEPGADWSYEDLL